MSSSSFSRILGGKLEEMWSKFLLTLTRVVVFKNYVKKKTKVLLFLYATLPFYTLCGWKYSDMRQAMGNVCFHITTESSSIWLLDCSFQRAVGITCCVSPLWLQIPRQDSQSASQVGSNMFSVYFSSFICPFFYSFSNWNIFFPFLINSLPPYLW